MLEQKSERNELKFQPSAMVVSSLILGYVVWSITGITVFGFYGIIPLTEKQIIVGWIFLPVCLIFTLACNLLVGKLFFKQRKWLNQVFVSTVGFNISYYLFQLIKDVFIDSGTFLFTKANFSVLVSVFVIINAFAFCLTTIIFLSFTLVSKLSVHKNLP